MIEKAACEAISLSDPLGLQALIVFVDGVPVGFIIRQTKRSYHLLRVVPKYRVRI